MECNDTRCEMTNTIDGHDAIGRVVGLYMELMAYTLINLRHFCGA